MATSKELTREDRIKKAYNVFNGLLKEIPGDRKKAAQGLMKRLAFMQITLEDLEEDINANGPVESFSQTEGIEYDRERPATRIYNSTIKNYQAAYKQLFDLLPAGTKDPPKADELMEFVKDQAR